MNMLIIGLVLFFATHSISIVNVAWRNRVAARIGTLSWQGIYSMAALAGLLLIIWGYGLARQDPVVLYLPPAWLRHVA
ncbi:MAG: NnrU family protein, partial [Gammaproteobacteria bacterium]